MRYIGNKAKLLDKIKDFLQEKDLYKEGLTFCDAFSGTGTVGNYFNGFYKIIANDTLDFSYYLTDGILNGSKCSFERLGFDPFEYFESHDVSEYTSGFCFNNFSPNGGCQYFSDSNAKKIDFVRDTIDSWYNDGLISQDEKSYLIMCLLEAVSKVANVAGVYSAFLKIWDSRALKDLPLQRIETKETVYDNEVYCQDINALIKDISGDILYLDPPYTPTQYNSQYHTLETIARNDHPITHGIGKHRDNDRLSDWCVKGKVEVEFAKLIKEANFEHILFSYSDKGIMSTDYIEAVMKRYGMDYCMKKIEFVKYKSTRAVNREIEDGTRDNAHYEYLFYIRKNREPKYISPLNYIGGKFSTLNLIKNNLPEVKGKFFDLFGGGGTVGLNANCNDVVYNEINDYVVELLKFLSDTHPYLIYKDIQKYIKKFGLSKANKEAYAVLRDEYNKDKKPILLYLLICYGFEHQIRFNSKHDFNNPCGNSGFNPDMHEKLVSYYLRCQELNISFNTGNYLDFADKITGDDFVYLDPPYLSTLGAYQDGKRGFNGWDKEQELEMYAFMDILNMKGIRFMLSNFVFHDEAENSKLLEWANTNGYKVIYDDKITKRNRRDRQEIVIINY